MNKTCARCQKVVYPIEELKCLDKTWHKTCFKCTECGMALNMKTYKGYNKMPYCEAHIPKAKATAIADTPELKRFAENTKIQSNVKYHADFEKAKGKFTQVADDPETLRIKQNTKHISNVAYHGDLEKKAAMEKQRGSAEVSDSSTTSQQHQQQQHHQQQVQQQQHQQQQAAALNPQQQALNSYNEMRSAILQNSHHPSGNAVDQYDQQQHPSQHQLQQHSSSNTATVQQQQQSHHSLLNNNPSNGGGSSQNNHAAINNNNGHGSNSQMLPPQQMRGGSNTDVAQMRSKHNVTGGPGSGTGIAAQNHLQQLYASPNYATVTPSENAIAAQNHLQQIYASPNYAAATPSENAMNVKAHSSNGHVPSQQQLMAAGGGGGGGGASNNIGKIADYDPLTDGPRAVPTAGRSSTTLVYSSEPRGIAGGNSVYPKRIGSISDIDPANGIYGSLTSAEQAHQQKQQQYYQQVQMMQQQEHPPQQQQQQQMRQQPSYVSLQDKQSRQSTALRVYRAIYDYEAQDVDEVSFREGDVIFEVESIDSGWMTGRVERTGKTGMLPANYVEQAVI
ncbi:LIM and SH3 domain protein Lasp isoform X3 [Drosophila ananassae]|uniref:LIM and SH3 domain protein Lasp isoform X3 n=1 Tax=Drosophila ananassae TaxID=7217 RepID=UPI0013A5E758|nr:LIM and SH3 domain protein Lasp isoform X3 [Drosophila ananassae]